MLDILLFPLGALLVFLDLLVMLLTFGWVSILMKALKHHGLRTVPVAEDEAHRVDPVYKGNLLTVPSEGIDTLYAMAVDSFRKYGDRKCMGTREFLGWKSAHVKHFGGTMWRSFAAVDTSAHKFGAALRARGLVAAPDVATLEKLSEPCSIAIFENTCPEWMISAVGAFSQSIIVTTVYATLGLDAVMDAINDGSIAAIVCNKLNVSEVLKGIQRMPTLKTIIYTNDCVAAEDTTVLPTPPDDVTIIAFEDFVATGDTGAFPPVPPKPDTCAVIMYTSGSTGKPKGVVVKHRNMVAAGTSIGMAVEGRPGDEVYLAYLPLAHILELAAEFELMGQGCTICYADPKSLTSKGAYPVGALEQYSPTMMAGVPKMWDALKKKIQSEIGATSLVLQYVARIAFAARSVGRHVGYETPLFNALVFRKFSKLTGGKLRIALSGGGPLNAEVQDFVATSLGVPTIQGYGLTETCAALTFQALDDQRTGIAGKALPCVEIKLDSCPDVLDKDGHPYLATDRVDVDGNKIFGRGEILAKGANVTLGYYMLPEKTKEEYDDDGFFHTGDIGQFMDDGSIRIVDRKKNLVKLKGGEYIALEKMEAIYGNSVFVDAIAGGICCYGDGDMDRPVALMQLSEPTAMKWARENEIEGSFLTVMESPKLMTAVMKDLESEHRKGGLSHLEKLQAVCFISKPWTPENHCLTAANKLQRRAVISMFEMDFEETKAKGIFL
uniref:AMP-dependent synthetase/ligase domain-containing protein n=1 Tax=Grammatophora oceanica TaxID=210454 RepID=A0A7S1YLD0_9STRA|mmetsp:Transcript_53344/g.79693  ORF Transcript_53344/g.79693 Transcript_53344/m.79693 type:complete len:722 (+) Transcript_53344:118-2283(+)